jgi:hypothetical protein
LELDNDPSGHKDMSGGYPEVVKRLGAYFDEMAAQVTRQAPRSGTGSGGIRRLTGGQLRYDLESKPSPDRR